MDEHESLLWRQYPHNREHQQRALAEETVDQHQHRFQYVSEQHRKANNLARNSVVLLGIQQLELNSIGVLIKTYGTLTSECGQCHARLPVYSFHDQAVT